MKCAEKLEKIAGILGVGTAGELSIVVLHRGWIFVGELALTEQGGYRLSRCRNVRKWSTGGFGGLTRGRKSSGATLDNCESITFAPEAAIFIGELSEGWEDE